MKYSVVPFSPQPEAQLERWTVFRNADGRQIHACISEYTTDRNVLALMPGAVCAVKLNSVWYFIVETK